MIIRAILRELAAFIFVKKQYVLNVRNRPEHERQSCGSRNRVRLVLREILVIDARRKFNVNVVVVKQLRPSKHDAQVHVKCISTPESSLSGLCFDMTGPGVITSSFSPI